MTLIQPLRSVLLSSSFVLCLLLTLLQGFCLLAELPNEGAAAAAAGLSRCSCESMTVRSIFSKALWWLRILSLCLQPRLFWWGRRSRHRRQNSCSRAPQGKHSSYFNFHFVTVYQGGKKWPSIELFGLLFKMYQYTSVLSTEIHTLAQKDRSVTAVRGVKHSWRRLADSGSRQTAIIKPMRASPGAAYIASANMILQANYLWTHKGKCQCAVLYLSVLAQMFFCCREGSQEGGGR